MYNLLTNRLRSADVSNGALAACALMLAMLIAPTVVFADFAATGDIVGTVNPAGGGSGDLIIGNVGTGGLLGDGVQPLIGTLVALQSDDVILGNGKDSIGAANIEDFIPGDDGNWQISGDLVVGHAGLGFLDLLNAAGVGNSPATSVAGNIFVGGDSVITPTTAPVNADDGRLGEGIIRVNGLGSRLQGQQQFLVGAEGLGLVEASGRASINTLGAAFIGSSDTSGDGTVRLTDLGTRWAASASVTVGGAASASVGKIQIQNEAVFQMDGNTVANVLTVNPRGSIELSTGGTLRMIPQQSNTITNNGTISGDGFIDGAITIGASGQLLNAAGVANDREYLLVSEAVTSAGLIESQGGEMEFLETVINNGDIVARDAIMRFRATQAGSGADLTNNGNLILGEATTVYGTIGGGGVITTIGPGTATDAVIFGNVNFDLTPLAASMDGELAASMAPSTGFSLTVAEAAGLLIDGDLDLGGVAELAINYVGEDPINEGDVLPVLSVTGDISGSFANSELIANGRSWDIDILGDDVLVTAGALVSGIDGDFDSDGDVDGSDFLFWQRNLGDPTSLAEWQSGYDTSGAALATTAVPEPTTLMLTLLALMGYPRRSRS